jgi:hypothetical protein
MKKILLFVTMIGLIQSTKLAAQNASVSSIEIAKVSQPCVMATYAFSQDLLDETIKAKFAEAKVESPDKSKGFKIYKGATFPEFGPEKVDIYIKTDGKKETSICYIAVSKGYDNFMNKNTDEKTIENVTTWLNNLVNAAAKVKLGHDIEDAEAVTKKAEKKYNSSADDGKDYLKDLEKLQKKIEDNKAEQAKMLKEMEDAKKVLEGLKAKLGQ